LRLAEAGMAILIARNIEAATNERLTFKAYLYMMPVVMISSWWIVRRLFNRTLPVLCLNY